MQAFMPLTQPSVSVIDAPPYNHPDFRAMRSKENLFKSSSTYGNCSNFHLLSKPIALFRLTYSSMNLLNALATVSGMTLISRILGFVRDVLIAASLAQASQPMPFLWPSAFRTCCVAFLPRVRFPRHSCPYLPNIKTAARSRKHGS